MEGISDTMQAGKGKQRRVLCRLGGIGAVVCMLLWWGGCSVENNYEFLSKIFDGVPDPNAPGKLDGKSIANSSTYSEHRPYVDEACTACHTDPTNLFLYSEDLGLCIQCHDQINTQYAYMHGAVTGNACLMCHNPHISALSNLLRENGPGMCLQCHEFDTEQLIPSHLDLERSCTDCHSGHGGDSPFFLRDHSETVEAGVGEVEPVGHQEGEVSDEP